MYCTLRPSHAPALRSELGREAAVERVAAMSPKIMLFSHRRRLTKICASWHEHRGPPGHVPGSPMVPSGGGDPPIRLQNPYIFPDTVWHPVARGQPPKSSS
ncbi:hypothetical protein V496_05176 [Pseudogymnoascus sp. VKM F-4515 (FW-2607)]|nr:hypothetical protein V496_05176 [Pseudogymnoascus sp. VKM F-4515 (FW-2607)]